MGRGPRTDDLAPVAVLQLAGHPLRWQLLHELGRSDRSVRELTELVAQPQNLVSYHLGKLRAAGVVSARRSSADGRDAYYAADLDRLGSLLDAAGTALHPSLGATAPAGAAAARQPPAKVLFLCTGNSARSQMAEALAVHLSGGAVDAASAGSNPKPMHPYAVQAMRARGIDISGNRTKHIDELRRRRFDVVVTLCDRVKEVCPELPSRPEVVHWSVADPSQDVSPGKNSYPAFERCAVDVERRVRHLLARLAARPAVRPTTPRRTRNAWH